MSTLYSRFSKLGFSRNDYKVYTVPLAEQSANIQTLVLASGVKRTIVYSVLDKLTKLGLVSKTSKGRKPVYFAEQPEKPKEIHNNQKREILDDLKHEEIAIEDLLPELNKLSRNTGTAPNFKLFHGLEGVWSIADDFLKTKADLFVMYSSTKLYGVIPFKDFRRRMTDRRRQVKPSKVYIITDPHKEALRIARLGEHDFHEFRFDQNIANLDSIIGYYSNRLILVTSQQPIWGLLIFNQSMVDSFKTLWHTHWQHIKNTT